MAIYSWSTHQKWWFSTVVLAYQRVAGRFGWVLLPQKLKFDANSGLGPHLRLWFRDKLMRFWGQNSLRISPASWHFAYWTWSVCFHDLAITKRWFSIATFPERIPNVAPNMYRWRCSSQRRQMRTSPPSGNVAMENAQSTEVRWEHHLHMVVISLTRHCQSETIHGVHLEVSTQTWATHCAFTDGWWLRKCLFERFVGHWTHVKTSSSWIKHAPCSVFLSKVC